MEYKRKNNIMMLLFGGFLHIILIINNIKNKLKNVWNIEKNDYLCRINL